MPKGDARIVQGRLPRGPQSAKKHKRSGNRKRKWKSKTRTEKHNSPAPARALILNVITTCHILP